jgi:hypothetical protein
MKRSRVLRALDDVYHRLVTSEPLGDGTSRVGGTHRPDVLDLFIIL